MLGQDTLALAGAAARQTAARAPTNDKTDRRVASTKPLPFVFFAAITVLQFFVVLLVYPETKGVSLEKIQKELHVA